MPPAHRRLSGISTELSRTSDKRTNPFSLQPLEVQPGIGLVNEVLIKSRPASEASKPPVTRAPSAQSLKQTLASRRKWATSIKSVGQKTTVTLDWHSPS